MLQTVEGILDPSGAVRLLEPIVVKQPTRIILTVLAPEEEAESGAQASEMSLAKDWLRPEEDEAWAQLASLKSL